MNASAKSKTSRAGQARRGKRPSAAGGADQKAKSDQPRIKPMRTARDGSQPQAASDKPRRKETQAAARAQPDPSRRRGPARDKSAAYPTLPAPISLVSAEPHPGQWLLTTREGSEQDLVDELLLAKVVDPAPRILAPALVLSPKLPRRDGRPMELTFARQGFEILLRVHNPALDAMARRIARSFQARLAGAHSYALQVWVPDSTLGNPLAGMAEALEEQIAARLAEALPSLSRVDDAALRRLAAMPLAQVCLIDPERAVAGVMHANKTLSLRRGGRTRVRISGGSPSRAARKLEEAFAWLGVEPGPADRCVDLGGAPGGWTYLLAQRRAHVVTVDPAQLRPEVLAMKGVRHVQDSAFTFAPDAAVDWLFCDMAWRPLEAAALLAKWGRKRWARLLVANIKLPMAKKAQVLARIRAILETEGHWKHVRAKQLYHDRDEITVTAHLG